MCVSAAEQLFRNATLLLNHERCTLFLPDQKRFFSLRGIDCDMDQSDDGHGVLPLRLVKPDFGIVRSPNVAGKVKPFVLRNLTPLVAVARYLGVSLDDLDYFIVPRVDQDHLGTSDEKNVGFQLRNAV